MNSQYEDHSCFFSHPQGPREEELNLGREEKWLHLNSARKNTPGEDFYSNEDIPFSYFSFLFRFPNSIEPALIFVLGGPTPARPTHPGARPRRSART